MPRTSMDICAMVSEIADVVAACELPDVTIKILLG